MRIFILRHGHAEPQKTTDETRNLTLNGRSEVAAAAAKSLIDLKMVQQVWVSPLTRAQQTASIVNYMLAMQSSWARIITTDLLVPEADPYALFKELQNVTADAVLLVSHQPLVGQVIDLLCGKYHGFHSMGTSSLACVDCDIVGANLGTLQWLRHSDE